MKTITNWLEEKDTIIKQKDEVIISQAKEIVALEERLEIGLQLIQEGVEMINQMTKGNTK